MFSPKIKRNNKIITRITLSLFIFVVIFAPASLFISVSSGSFGLSANIAHSLNSQDVEKLRVACEKKNGQLTGSVEEGFVCVTLDENGKPVKEVLTKPGEVDDTSFFNVIDNIGDEALATLIRYLGTLLIGFFSIILWIAGVLFNYSVIISIVEMKDYVESIAAIEGIWTIIRDIGNMAFIFVMLYISIGTILNLSSFNLKLMIRNIILAALLVNFSLFFAKVVIDASNILALGVYNNSTTQSTATGYIDVKNPKFGLSGAFLQGLKLGSIFDVKNTDGSALSGLAGEAKDTDGSPIPILEKSQSSFIAVVLGSILVLVTAFVFFAGAILLLIRFVVLVFLMMISPIAFLAIILPQTKKFADMWWNTLLHQAFFAPLFMLMLYITIRFVNDDSFKSGLALFGEPENPVVTLMNYLVAIILALLAIIVSKKMGAYGADLAQKGAGKLSFGLAGAVGRRFVGQRAYNASLDKDLLRRAKEGDRGAMLKLKTLDFAAKSSFDVRAAPGASSIGQIAKGVNLGTPGGKGGYAKVVEEQGKARETTAKSLAEKAKSAGLSAVGQVKIKLSYGLNLNWPPRLWSRVPGRGNIDRRASQKLADEARTKAEKEREKAEKKKKAGALKDLEKKQSDKQKEADDTNKKIEDLLARSAFNVNSPEHDTLTKQKEALDKELGSIKEEAREARRAKKEMEEDERIEEKVKSEVKSSEEKSKKDKDKETKPPEAPKEEKPEA